MLVPNIVGYTGVTGLCEISGFYFEVAELPTFPMVKNYQDKHDLEIMEVIGNTYEK